MPEVAHNTFSLIVPTINEAGNIDTLLTEVTVALSQTEYEYEIIVVDDGSTDGTVEKVRDWGARDSRVRLLSRHGERGLAGAVLYGWSQGGHRSHQQQSRVEHGPSPRRLRVAGGNREHAAHHRPRHHEDHTPHQSHGRVDAGLRRRKEMLH